MKVNHGRMKEDDARRYFQQLINAVDYCHSRGVFHRDLKVVNFPLKCGVRKYYCSIIWLMLVSSFTDAAGKLTSRCCWKPQSFRFRIKCSVPTSPGKFIFCAYLSLRVSIVLTHIHNSIRVHLDRRI